jgi:hypothetical protein
LLSLADGQGTSEAHVAAIIQAQMINRVLGGALVAPWEVDELPNEWLDVFRAMAVELPELRQGKQRVQERLAQWRAGKD